MGCDWEKPKALVGGQGGKRPCAMLGSSRRRVVGTRRGERVGSFSFELFFFLFLLPRVLIRIFGEKETNGRRNPRGAPPGIGRTGITASGRLCCCYHCTGFLPPHVHPSAVGLYWGWRSRRVTAIKLFTTFLPRKTTSVGALSCLRHRRVTHCVCVCVWGRDQYIVSCANAQLYIARLDESRSSLTESQRERTGPHPLDTWTRRRIIVDGVGGVARCLWAFQTHKKREICASRPVMKCGISFLFFGSYRCRKKQVLDILFFLDGEFGKWLLHCDSL